jgi:hypothetical protein
MASCPDCGAEVTIAHTRADEPVPLERWTQASGANRYRIVGMAPLTVELVSESSAIDAYPDHRPDCPGHGNGLGARLSR